MTLVDLLRRYAASREEPALPSEKRAWPADLMAEYEERAAVAEYDGNLGRSEAEARAEAEVRRLLEGSGQ